MFRKSCELNICVDNRNIPGMTFGTTHGSADWRHGQMLNTWALPSLKSGDEWNWGTGCGEGHIFSLIPIPTRRKKATSTPAKWRLFRGSAGTQSLHETNTPAVLRALGESLLSTEN